VVARLGCCLDDDCPTIDWARHARMADLWLKIDERHKARETVDDVLRRVAYSLRLNRRWPRIDCLAMMPELAVSVRARAALKLRAGGTALAAGTRSRPGP
jgi:hypothetical protein